MTSAAVPVLTDQEIAREMEAEAMVLHLYNPSNRWIEARYGALLYRLRPDGEALDKATGQVATTDGITAIKDTYGEDWVEDQETRRRSTTGNRICLQHATEIVKHILKTYGPMGVVRLKGDEKKDATVKAEAKKRWVNHRVAWASEVIANRDAYLLQFHAAPSNAGQMPNPPNGLEIEAIEFMADYRLGVVGRKSFACVDCGYQTDDSKAWDKHMRAFHPEKANKEAAAEPGTGGTDKGGKGGRGRT